MPDRDPFAEAGFQAQQPAAAPADPFAAAGFVAPPPAYDMPPAPPPPQFFYQNGQLVSTSPAANQAITQNLPRAGEQVAEGATFGMFPYIGAVGRWITGEPWDAALAHARAYTKETEEQAPGASAVLQAGGSLLPTSKIVGALKVPGEAVERAVPYVGKYLAEGLKGATVGGTAAGAKDVGSGETGQLGSDVATGATLGGVAGVGATALGQGLQAGANLVRSTVAPIRSMFTNEGKDAIAGQVLRETLGTDQMPPVAQSPIPGLDLRTSQATSHPEVARLDLATGNPAYTPEQKSAVVKALVSDTNTEPTVLANRAASRGTGAIQDLDTALGKVETKLWQNPALKGLQFNGPGIAAGVRQDVAALPASWRDAVTGPQGTLGAYLRELDESGPNASLQDLNSVRSRLLGEARDARAAGDGVKASAATAMAGKLLDRIGADPAFAGAPEQTSQLTGYFTGRPVPGTATTTPAIPPNPDAVAAYQKARDFTRQYNTVLGHPEFDKILIPNKAGNVRGDPETAFRPFVDTRSGTSGGLDKLQGAIDFARANGVAGEADQLQNATQDYVKARALADNRATGSDIHDRPNINMGGLNRTLSIDLPAISGSSVTQPIAADVANARDAARLIDMPNNVQRGMGSVTAEKLQKNDLMNAVVSQTATHGLGAAGGAYLGYEHGPEALPPVSRALLGAAIGAAASGRTAPLLGKMLSGFGPTKELMSGPAKDILARVQSGLASPQEFQRLLGKTLLSGPGIFDQGAASTGVPSVAPYAVGAYSRRP